MSDAPDQQYSLKWSNHPDNILNALDTLLQSENLVDVTLICGKSSLRAHRVILSACSPFFQKIFAETPCNHPVVVLNEFQGAEVQALINFMYRGEVSVAHTRLDALMKAAESLQIRGLADKKNPDPVHAVIYEGDESGCGSNYLNQASGLGAAAAVRSPAEGSTPVRIGSVSPSTSSTYDHPSKHVRQSYMEVPTTRAVDCISPTPRRKQARPRRRSGDNCSVQDLSTSSPRSPVQQEEVAENLCIKKTEERPFQSKREVIEVAASLPDPPQADVEMRDYRTSPIVLNQPPMGLNQDMDSHPHMPFPPMPSVSALAMTPPHGKYFGMEPQPLGLFPPGLENCRNPLYEMDHRAQDPHGLVKKKIGRPKGQHSAPRGGPPRSWTNSELTNALQHVWNKKMTTSQASRVFGIPYNSLLMYVRGKYGKSLKLEQLRKDCIGASNQTSDLMAVNSTNNNNTVVKTEREAEPMQPNTRPSSVESQPPPPAHPHFLNPFLNNFYPEFNNFPLPLMHQFMPQNDRSREHFNQPQQQPQAQLPSPEVDNSNSEALEEDTERFRSPTRSIDERQQNGQD
ncbi:protein jim lovell isoform X2 [Harmonia axyridis]|uniref:protein jim lovell isoform X2 n=1 Tax=Harmonia axyridis TaxID=115357 RepID=UPI001E274FFA|nr:protein jim lovell isoform X2 [Harmonia axyridis]